MYFGEGKQLRAKEMAKETFSFEMTYSLKQNAGFFTKENTNKIFHKFKKEKLVSDGYNAFLQDQEHVD